MAQTIKDLFDNPDQNQPVKETRLYVKDTNGDVTEFKVDSRTTIGELKRRMQQANGIMHTKQRFIYNGKELKDDMSLEYYRVKKDHTIYLIVGSISGW